MLENLRIDPAAKTIINLPEGWETLLLVKLTDMGSFLYTAVIGPQDACTCTDENPHRNLAGFAKVLFFTVENIRIFDVLHGHKCIFGGGVVTFDSAGHVIKWATDRRCCGIEVYGNHIFPGDVLIAL